MHLIAYRCRIWPKKFSLGNSSVCKVENFFQSVLQLLIKLLEKVSVLFTVYVSVWSSVTDISYSTRLLTKQWQETLGGVWEMCYWLWYYVQAEGDRLSEVTICQLMSCVQGLSSCDCRRILAKLCATKFFKLSQRISQQRLSRVHGEVK